MLGFQLGSSWPCPFQSLCVLAGATAHEQLRPWSDQSFFVFFLENATRIQGQLTQLREDCAWGLRHTATDLKALFAAAYLKQINRPVRNIRK